MKTPVNLTKLPQPARKRTLPPDAASLETMIRALHALIAAKIGHLKTAPHDVKAQRALAKLLRQRFDAWNALRAKDRAQAKALAGELELRTPETEEK